MAPYVLAFVFLCCSSASALGADWFVAAGAAEGGDGTEVSPFARISEAMAVAVAGDRVNLAGGVYSELQDLSVYGNPRRAVLVLVEGVQVRGAGRGVTFLRVDSSSGAPAFGITAQGVSRATTVSDLTIDGACFQGVNLREAAPRLERIDILNDVTGASSVALDARDGSDPFCSDVRFDGGHSALFVEFGSSGTYRDCRIGVRPNEAMSFSDADPVLERVVIEGAGRDVLVLNQGSQPVLRECSFLAAGGRWTVRVAVGYEPGSTIDLSGNRWYTSDLAVLEADVLDAADDPTLGLRVHLEPLGTPVAAESGGWGRFKSNFSSGQR